MRFYLFIESMSVKYDRISSLSDDRIINELKVYGQKRSWPYFGYNHGTKILSVSTEIRAKI
jgi:hypothetical protein